tara:strand:+ start:2573 stop:3499 length:927 start_codon:yes stop_codon:yes gene_type:complete
MKFNLLIIFFFIAIIFFSNDGYAKKNKILFKVNNEIITSIDLLEETKFLRAINEELENVDNSVIYEISKKSIIRNKIKEIELSKKIENANIKENDLKKILLNYFSRFNINSENELENFFNQKKINKKYIEKRITTEILWNEYIFIKYSKNIKINENQIRDELKNKKKQYKYLLSEILFNLENNENLKQKYEKIKNVIKSKGFAEAALSFSIASSSDKGGKLDWIKETSLNNKIREKIKNMNIGNHTTPIVIPGGFLILKIDDRKITEIEINIENEVKQISKKRTNEQLNQFSSIYFNKIKKNIIINEY